MGCWYPAGECDCMSRQTGGALPTCTLNIDCPLPYPSLYLRSASTSACSPWIRSTLRSRDLHKCKREQVYRPSCGLAAHTAAACCNTVHEVTKRVKAPHIILAQRKYSCRGRLAAHLCGPPARRLPVLGPLDGQLPLLGRQPRQLSLVNQALRGVNQVISRPALANIATLPNSAPAKLTCMQVRERATAPWQAAHTCLVKASQELGTPRPAGGAHPWRRCLMPRRRCAAAPHRRWQPASSNDWNMPA